MTDTPTKTRNLQPISQPSRPTTWWARGGGAVRSDKTGALFQAQDTALVGRRVVAQFGPGSPAARIPTNSNASDVSTIYPVVGETFTATIADARLTPGSWLEFRALCLATGPVQDGVNLDNVAGEVRAETTYTNAATLDTQTITGSAAPPVSSMQYAGVPTGAGAYFEALRPVWFGLIRPTPVNDPATAATYGEATYHKTELQMFESSRVLSVTLSEVPYLYATDDTQADPTAHAATSPQPPDSGPREETPDGATFADDRYGTQRMLDAAENAPLRTGPVLLHWSCYSAAAWTPGAEDTALTIALAATGGYQRVNITDTSQTTYDAGLPGWPILAHLATQDATSSAEALRNQAAAIPVTLHVRYRASGVAASAVVCVRTERSQVRVVCTPQLSTVVAVATGYIEGSATHEDALGGVAQIFVEGDNFTVELVSITLEYGHVLT